MSFPPNLTEIGKSAFDSCGGLTEVVFQLGLIEIGKSAFSECRNLIGPLSFPEA